MSDLTLCELLREGSEFALWRACRQDGTKVLALMPMAEHLASASFERLEHEYSLRAECLAAGAVAPLELSHADNRPLLILQDPGGEPLENLISRDTSNAPEGMDIARFLGLAVALAEALGRVHARGLVHKDVKPSSILVDEKSGAVHLTGFGFASQAERRRQAPEPLETIAGSLPYMAPEQTGRMNRSVDARSDLYSLGVVFYRLLTGSLPFTAKDPMGWVYSHIAVVPKAPTECRPTLPPQLSALVMKLLSKEVEGRYQTAAGLTADLTRCRDAWRANGKIDEFALGVVDRAGQLLIPEKLYGRESEIAALVAAFERVAASGTNEMVLVSGYSGIGKSALVGELQKVIVMPRGLYGSGKFDQYKRDVPYAILAEIFGAFVRQILSFNEADLARWRQAIVDAVGSNGQLLIDLIPDLARVIGSQPEVGTLSPAEVQNRFFGVFTQFVAVFATAEHPLILFLDDLQWLDHGSLKLLEHLATRRDLHHLLLIGGYRDNEVGPSHPLMLTLDAIRKAGVRILDIVLGPLAAANLDRLLSDALRCDPTESTFLATLILEKTGGNPFFALQFLSTLYEEGLIAFDVVAAKWVWDVERIRAKGYTDNVVDLMLAKLQRLSLAAQRTMMVGACIGTAVSLKALAMASERSDQQLEADLVEPFRHGYLLRQKQIIRFAHDRIQEAAYLLIPPGERAGEHLRIGRRLLAGMTPDEVEESIFDVVRQYNAGVALVTSPEEKTCLGGLNAFAGRRAKASGANASAQFYLANAVAQLPEDAWRSRYAEAFALHLELAETEFLIGSFARADELFNLLLLQAESNVDRATVFRMRILLYQVAGRYGDAVAAAREGLRMLGIDCPDDEGEAKAQVAAARQEVLALLRGRIIADLILAPPASNPEARAVLGIVANAMPSAYFAWPPLYPWLILKALTLTLREGNAAESCAAYMGYAILLAGFYREIDLAFAFSELALALQEKLNQPQLRGRLLCRHSLFINSHRYPMTNSIEKLEQAFLLCREAGDLAYAAYSALDVAWLTMETGAPLARTRAVVGKYRAFAEQSRNEALRHTLRAQDLYLSATMAEPGIGSFEEDSTESDESLAFLSKGNFGAGVAYYFLLRQMAAYSAGRYGEALDCSARVAAVLPSIKGWVAETTYHFYVALSCLAANKGADEDQCQACLGQVAEHVAELAFQSRHCPENFQHRHLLVQAELARFEGRDGDAMRHYEEAIESARKGGFTQTEALANELAAGFFMQRNSEKAARAYLVDARDSYFRWGALRKVDALDRRYPHLGASVEDEWGGHQGINAGSFDAMAMLKSYQAISGEIVLERLLQTLMDLVVQTAGAERALLLLEREKSLVVVAEVHAGSGNHDVHILAKPVDENELPERVVNYVYRTWERVLLADAHVDAVFAEDTYVHARKTRSVLCLPILKQGGFVGIFYLENNLLAGAFTERHVATLELLGLQAAISIDNAMLYSELEQRVEARTRALRAEVSERQIAQARLRQTLTELELILEHASLGIAIIHRVDGKRRFGRVNRTLETLLGYEHGELDGMDTRIIYVSDEKHQQLEVVYDEVLRAGLSHRSEQQFKCKDGRAIYTEIVGVAIDPQDLGKGTIWLFEDVTERRMAQMDLVAANSDLKTTLDRLKLAQDELLRTEKLAALGSLVAGVAHELNTPIGNALTVASTLQYNAEELVNMMSGPMRRAELQAFLENVREAADLVQRNLFRAAELVNSFKQVAVDQTSSQRRIFVLRDVVAEIVTTLYPSFKKTPYKVEFEIDELIEMDSFPGPLGQVIVNLITNAIIHGFEGRENGTVRLVAHQLEGEFVELEAIDDGRGIPQRDLGRIFDPFFTTRMGQGSSGLGLNIVHTIVTGVLGGKIAVKSEVGQGTTFTLRLPNVAPVLRKTKDQ